MISFAQCRCQSCREARSEVPHLQPNPTGDGASVDACTSCGADGHEGHTCPLTAEDVATSHLDTDTLGRIFPETKLASALQVLRSIRDEQPTASAVVRGLAGAILERLK